MEILISCLVAVLLLIITLKVIVLERKIVQSEKDTGTHINNLYNSNSESRTKIEKLQKLVVDSLKVKRIKQ